MEKNLNKNVEEIEKIKLNTTLLETDIAVYNTYIEAYKAKIILDQNKIKNFTKLKFKNLILNYQLKEKNDKLKHFN